MPRYIPIFGGDLDLNDKEPEEFKDNELQHENLYQIFKELSDS